MLQMRAWHDGNENYDEVYNRLQEFGSSNGRIVEVE